MAKKKVVVKKLDRDGFIFVLAIGALALIFFTFYLFNSSLFGSNKEAVAPIESSEELDIVLKDVDSENPDTFKEDLNENSKDAVNF